MQIHRCKLEFESNTVVNLKLFCNFILILLTNCAFAKKVTICMFEAISQTLLMLAIIQHFVLSHITSLQVTICIFEATSQFDADFANILQ